MKYKNKIKKEPKFLRIAAIIIGSILLGLFGSVLIIYANGAKIHFEGGLSIRSNKSKVEATKAPETTGVPKASTLPTTAPSTAATVQPPEATIAPTIAPEKVKEVKKEVSDYIKAVYVNPSSAVSETKTASLIELAKTTELNAFVVNVKDESGYLTFDLGVEQAKKIGAVKKNAPTPEKFLKSLKENNIYSIARIVVFKDAVLAKSDATLTVKNKDGKSMKDSNAEAWVNPYSKAVWDYEISIAKAAIASGFDEVQLEYVRFNGDSKFQNANYGDTAKNITKSAIIVEFTKKTFEEITASGGMLSLSLYGAILSSQKDAAALGQDYAGLSQYLDYICPMIYPASYSNGSFGKDYPDLYPYEVIKGALEKSIEQQATVPVGSQKATVRPWLQGYTATSLQKHQTYGKDQIKAQIKAVYDTKYANWMIWNGSSNYETAWFEKQ